MPLFAIKEISDVIAERRLTLDGKPNKNIRVLLGRPQSPDGSDQDHRICPFQILGIGDEKVRSISGVDDFQCLQLVQEIIGAYLYSLNRANAGALRWDGGRDGDLGFPGPPGIERGFPDEP